MGAIFDRLNEKIVDRYGMGLVIRQYGFYPSWLPLTISGEHGPNLADFPAEETLLRDSPYYFAYAERKKSWPLPGKMLVRHPSPFIWYQLVNKITKSAAAKGTIFFYTHSTKQVKSTIDEDLFFENLKSIPLAYHPITLCLHFNSREKRFIKRIEAEGYKWITLGGNYGDNLIKKFYDEVPKFKFAMGNNFSSAFLYCAHLGIPGSIVFTEGISYTNNGNNKYKEHKWDLKNHPIKRWREAMELFGGFNAEVSDEQKEFVFKELGLDLLNSIPNRLKVMISLYSSLVICSFKQGYRLMMSGVKQNQRRATAETILSDLKGHQNEK